MSQTSRSIILASAALAALGLATGASAQTFHFDSYGGFVSGTATPAATANAAFVDDPDTATGAGTWDVGSDADPRTAAGRFKDVTWGAATTAIGPYEGKSGFALSKVNDGTVAVNGALVDFGKLTHFNREIATGTSLQTVEMDWSLQLFATPADAAANANPVQTTNLSFTLYNWETTNNPAQNPVHTVSYDNGQTWTTVGPGVCPGATPVGTLIVGPLGKIYRSANADNPSNPVWNGECSDAHIYEGSASNVYTFTRDSRLYEIELIGFYGPTGALTYTFWACEQQQCFGTVKFRIRDVTPTDIPTMSEWALVLTGLLLAGVAALRLRRQQGRAP